MNGPRLIIFNLIVWTAAISLFLFRDEMLIQYYRFINGTQISIDKSIYNINGNSFLMKRGSSDLFGIGYKYGGNIISILIRKKTKREFESYQEIFPNEFEEHKTNDCSFLERKTMNKNLPALIWFHKSYNLLFTIDHKPENLSKIEELCVLVSSAELVT